MTCVFLYMVLCRKICHLMVIQGCIKLLIFFLQKNQSSAINGYIINKIGVLDIIQMKRFYKAVCIVQNGIMWAQLNFKNAMRIIKQISWKLTQSLPVDRGNGLQAVWIFSPNLDWTITCAYFSAKNFMNFSISFLSLTLSLFGGADIFARRERRLSIFSQM